MNKTLKTLTAFALATATLTAVASANITLDQGNVHGPVQNVHGPIQNVHGAGTLAGVTLGVTPPVKGTGNGSQPPHLVSCRLGVGCTNTPVGNGPGQVPPREIFPTQPPGKVVSCHPVTGCTITPPDRDHDHDHDYDRDHRHWWKYGWERPRYLIGGEYAPITEVVAPAPISQGRVSAPVVAQQPAEPCNCLTKQYLQDGSVLFSDICSKEQAMAASPAVGTR
jgi:hypothetical protein